MAFLAGYQNFAAAARSAQVLAAFGTAEIFIYGAIPEFLCLVFDPASAGAGEEIFNGEPDFLENTQFTLTGGYVARKHAEDKINFGDVGKQPDPEHAGNLRGKGNDKT